MVKQEAKCPHCKRWTERQGALHDRCNHCNEFLELEKINRRIAVEEQQRIDAEIAQTELDQQHPLMRKLTDYATVIFIGFMLSVIGIVVLFAA